MADVLHAIHEARVALVSAGVRSVAIEVDPASYLLAIYKALPDVRCPRPGAKAFVVWDRSFAFGQMDPAAPVNVHEVWLTPEQEREFVLMGVRVRTASVSKVEG